MPKALGGLGFQDLHLFNQVLVAKQAQCLVCNPNSLVGQILKGKYYHNSNFVEANDKVIPLICEKVYFGGKGDS